MEKNVIIFQDNTYNALIQNFPSVGSKLYKLEKKLNLYWDLGMTIRETINAAFVEVLEVFPDELEYTPENSIKNNEQIWEVTFPYKSIGDIILYIKFKFVG